MCGTGHVAWGVLVIRGALCCIVCMGQDPAKATSVTFASLESAARRLAASVNATAASIQASQGPITPEGSSGSGLRPRVGVCCSSGYHNVVAVLGCLMAGLPYVPLDPSAVG